MFAVDNDKLLTDKKEILKRWAEHFNSLLNHDSSMCNDAINSISQHPILQVLDELPSLQEVNKAIKQISSGEAPGADGIPAEIYKHGGHTMSRKLTQEFKDASIVHIYCW